MTTALQNALPIQRLGEMPLRRKAQLLGLALSQAVRHVERHLINSRTRLEGPPVTLVRWLIVATTDACNLRCVGCYAKPVWAHRHVPFSRLDYVAWEAERQAARQQSDSFRSLIIYKCPMAPKPGQTSFWMQLRGPLKNPFYGVQMLDCGSEVTP